MNKQRSLLVAPLHYRLEDAGSETGWAYHFAYQLIQAAERPLTFVTGWQVTPISAAPEVIQEVTGTPFPPTELRALQFHLKVVARVRRLLNGPLRGKPVILHHFLPFAQGRTIPFSLLLAGTNARTVVGPIQQPPTWEVSAPPSPVKRIVLTSIARLSWGLLKRADRIVVLEEQTATELREKLGGPAERVVVIPAGIIPVAQKEVQEALSKRASRGSKEFRLLTVGNLLPHKGVSLIIEAVAQLRDENIPVHLDIVGEGIDRKALEQIINERKLEDAVTLHGRMSLYEVNRFYQVADVYVSMSSFESWGQVYLEAMQWSLPIISLANRGAKAIIIPGETGWLLQELSADRLADQLLSVVAYSPHELQDIGRAARKRVEQEYDWKEAVIPRYLALYRTLDSV